MLVRDGGEVLVVVWDPLTDVASPVCSWSKCIYDPRAPRSSCTRRTRMLTSRSRSRSRPKMLPRSYCPRYAERCWSKSHASTRAGSRCLVSTRRMWPRVRHSRPGLRDHSRCWRLERGPRMARNNLPLPRLSRQCGARRYRYMQHRCRRTSGRGRTTPRSRSCTSDRRSAATASLPRQRAAARRAHPSPP